MKELEFKPLTEGLGFHQRFEKKIEQIKEQMKSASLGKDISAKVAPPTIHNSALGGLEFYDEPRSDVAKPSKKTLFEDDLALQLSRTLPREDELPRKKAPDAATYVLSREMPVASLEIEEPQESALVETQVSKKIVSSRQLTWWSMSAAFLDGIIVSAFFLLFVIAMLMVTKVKVISSILGVADTMVVVCLGLLFVSIVGMYMIIARSWSGCTLGEWAFDLRIGGDEQQRKASYPLKIAVRTLVVMLTGFVTLPLLSLVFGWDLAGLLSGVRLQYDRPAR